MKKILLIEDDLHMCELLTDYMNCKGYHITAVHRLDSLVDISSMSAHRGKKRAYVAVAHSMLTAIYHMLKDGVVFKDLGADYYNQFNRERKINACLRKLERLGYRAEIAAT